MSLLHLTYCVVGTFLSWAWVILGLNWVVHCTILSWGWFLPTIICRCHWRACPLTVLEEALRSGRDRDNAVWMRLRKTSSFDEALRRLFVQMVLTWAATMAAGILLLLVVGGQ